MPWFDVNPSQSVLDFFQSHPARSTRHVAKWPHPNTVRINCRFRVKDTDPELIPLASRYGLYYHKAIPGWDPDDVDFSAFGWWEFEVRGDNHIGVTTEENSAGYTLDINIKHFEELPSIGTPGIEYRVDFDHAALGILEYHEEYPASVMTNLWKYDMNTFVFSDIFHGYWTQPVPPYAELLLPRLFAADECYEFDPPAPEMAEFNGTDAYIALTSNLANVNQDFIISADIRLHNTTGFWPIMGREGQGGFLGMDEEDLIFGSLRLASSWTPVLDEWFSWRLEFEQDGQLKYKLFINDTEVLDRTTNRQNILFNTLGVYRHGVSGTIWADMDMKNLVFLNGDNPSTDVELDMPLFEDALDDGPNENHGTTFNMALPST